MAEATDTLSDLSDLGTATGVTEPELPEPQIDARGRSYATGRRKDAVARVWIKPGSGRITVNGKDVAVYFARPVLQMIVNQPFKVVERANQFDVFCTVRGGGLTRDSRVVERKKYGKRKARRSFQFSKR